MFDKEIKLIREDYNYYLLTRWGKQCAYCPENKCVLCVEEKNTYINYLKKESYNMTTYNNEHPIHRTLKQVDEDESELMKELDEYAEDIDNQAYAQGRKSSLDKYGNPIITGDTDTDELLEDERIAQEDQAIDQIINHKRGK